MKKIKIILTASLFALLFLGLRISDSNEANSTFEFSLESKAFALEQDPIYQACTGDWVSHSWPEFGEITCLAGGSGGVIPHFNDIPYTVCVDMLQSCCPMEGFDPVPTCQS